MALFLFAIICGFDANETMGQEMLIKYLMPLYWIRMDIKFLISAVWKSWGYQTTLDTWPAENENTKK